MLNQEPTCTHLVEALRCAHRIVADTDGWLVFDAQNNDVRLTITDAAACHSSLPGLLKFTENNPMFNARGLAETVKLSMFHWNTEKAPEFRAFGQLCNVFKVMSVSDVDFATNKALMKGEYYELQNVTLSNVPSNWPWNKAFVYADKSPEFPVQVELDWFEHWYPGSLKKLEFGVQLELSPSELAAFAFHAAPELATVVQLPPSLFDDGVTHGG